MDDHELGALLDAAVPGAPASDAVLDRVRRRASQRRRRSALAGGALSIAMAAALAVGISAVGGSLRSATPAGRSTSSSLRSGITTMAAIPRCLPGDVSMTINPHSESFEGTTTWAVTAVSHADAPCRLTTPMIGSIRNRAGQVLIADYGPNHGRVPPDDPGYVSALTSDTPTLVAQISWTLACMDVPTELEVAGLSAAPARLAVPARPCPPNASGRSAFLLSGGAVGAPGGGCPFGSLTLAIDPHAVRTGNTTRWAVTATSNASVLCRTHAGIAATIEKPDGTVLGTVSGNPAQQGNDRFQDLFRPATAEFVGYLSWSNACRDTPARLVARFEDGSYGHAASLDLPSQPCTARTETSHFQVDLGIPGTASSPAP